MVRGFSITNEHGFWEIAFGLCVVFIGSFIWNLYHGGIIVAITSLFSGIFGIVLAIVLLSIIFVKVYPLIAPYRMFIE